MKQPLAPACPRREPLPPSRLYGENKSLLRRKRKECATSRQCPVPSAHRQVCLALSSRHSERLLARCYRREDPLSEISLYLKARPREWFPIRGSSLLLRPKFRLTIS